MDGASEVRKEQWRNASEKYRAKRSVDSKRVEVFLDKEALAVLQRKAKACGRSTRFNKWLAEWIKEQVLG